MEYILRKTDFGKISKLITDVNDKFTNFYLGGR